MAKVSLRSYNREIEVMIGEGHLEEAVGHCKHILKTYPKHLETYQLLGKAYLEARRYQDASDVFLRLLAATPNDFLAQVAMSMIYEATEKLDDAIWHMERAFEVQPSNAAVQNELQRLYGRRDGVQPSKIRMTSGALANVYMQGELYPQAIAEILSVEAREPGRPDMQELLALAYFRSGQRVEASKIASDILAKSPYNLVANRILVTILPETSRAESTQVYRHRLTALDPYTNFVQDSVWDTQDVADNAVTIEKLDWQPGDTVFETDGNWNHASIQKDDASEEQPDWLKNAEAKANADFGLAADPEPAAEPEDNIPDFMRAAGWGVSDGSAEEPVSFFDSPDPYEDNPSDDDTPIAQAELPDWMKNIAPAQAELDAVADDLSENGDAMSDDDFINDLFGDDDDTPAGNDGLGSLDDLGDLGTSSAEQDAALNWLEQLAANQGANPEELITDPNARTQDAPEWVQKAAGGTTPSEPATTMPPAASENDDMAWLNELDADTAEPTPAADDALDWLNELDSPAEETPATPTDDLPDWLSDLGSTAEETTASPAPNEDMPDWLNDLRDDEEEMPAVPAASPIAETPPPPASTPSSGVVDDTIGTLGTSDAEQDAALNWLEQLAANQGANPDELITDPNARTEAAPEWVQQAQQVSDTPQPPTEEPVQVAAAPAEDIPDWLQEPAVEESEPQTPVAETPSSGVVDDTIGTLGTSDAEQDAALNWLEQLAANQGANPDELITDPNARTEAAPEWVQQAQQVNGTPQPPTEEPVQAAEAPAEDIPDWLQEPAVEESEPQTPVAETPSSGVVDDTIGTLGTSDAEQDAALNWLEQLAANQGANPDELITDPNARTEAAPEWVQQAQQVSDAPQPPTEEPVQAAEAAATVPVEEVPAANADDNWRNEQSESSPAPAATEAPEEVTAAPEPSTPQLPADDDVPAWLRDDDDIEEVPAAWQPSEETPATPETASAADEERLLAEKAEEKLSYEAPAAQPTPTAEATAESPVSPTAQEEPAQPVSGTSTAWLNELVEEEQQAQTTSEPQAIPKTEKADDLPDWLASDASAKASDSTKEEAPPKPAAAPSRDFSDWLEEEPAKEPAPTSGKRDFSGWLEEEKKPVASSKEKDRQPAAPEKTAKPTPAPEPPISLPPRRKVQRMNTTMLRDITLMSAQAAMREGNISAALAEYGKLIKKKRLLDETIYDLREALYDYPIDISIWQMLGDAYMRAGQLQEAINAYTKAEELLR